MLKNFATLAAFVFILAACQASALDDVDLLAADSALDFPQLSCAPHGRPNGEPARLTAHQHVAGHRAYIEFRQRLSPAIPSGHLYVVFGRLNARGEVLTRQYVGLYPVGSLIGLYGGAIVPMPAELTPSYSDCRFNVQAAYRVSLDEQQYRRLLNAVRDALADPPQWHMAAFNCNHFAASLGNVVGLQAPRNRLLPAFAYIHALIGANGAARTDGA
ncbi:hypothetical protein GRZ55_03155 [Chelativorans sp. ZYF759]|uniref:hypothetical protein n=1 Tax=Chelativorans sp. ZYF759 TaxID=2692213 RepID=UPI00145F391A|nr:hypothetical protein [Chelativorans sp. ZYF759]NMG38238.1 hypothetical protein [Chelativorans sp. ZYF759]